MRLPASSLDERDRGTRMWTLFLIPSLLVLGDLTHIVKGEDECSEGWESIHRGCYYFNKNPFMNWEDASMDCQARGGELISVSDFGEKSKLVRKLRGEDKGMTWWVGLKRVNGLFSKWQDGGDFSYRITRWKAGEPNNEGGKEDCVEINAGGQLNDKDCNSLRAFICEQHDITARPTNLPTEPPTTPSTTTTTSTTQSAATSPTTSKKSDVKSQGSNNDAKTKTPNGQVDEARTVPTRPTPDRRGDGSDENDDNYDVDDDDDGEDEASETLDEGNNQGKGQGQDKKEDKATTTTPRGPNRGNGQNDKFDSDDQEDDREEEEEVNLYELYSGCFMYQSEHSQSSNRPFLYTREAMTCPQIVTSGTTWPETGHGETRYAPCRGNKVGNMSFSCGGEPTCWRGEPNVDDCANPRLKSILSVVAPRENITEAPEPEETMQVAEELADVTDGDDVTEEDIAVTSKVIKGLVTSGAAKKVKDKKEVTNIVANVVRAGSNLVSSSKTEVWDDMAEHDKIRSATSLLVAMETATVAMAEEIDEPTTIVTKQENIELELRVINITATTGGKKEKIKYSAEDSDTEFSIPLQTLSHLSKGGLAKVVFMTHYSVGDILGERDDSDDSSAVDGGNGGPAVEAKPENRKVTPPKLASYILSASVGGSATPVNLPEPISFTMQHIKSVPEGFESLCSFWSIAENGLGEWSQEGCRVVNSNANQTTCECDHMTNFAVLMAVKEVELSDMHMSMLRLVTIVGCIISCLCLLASWVTFTCFTTLQGERNSIHKNLVVCLFVAEMLFLTGIDQTQNRLACGLVAGFLHYFFLAAFLWMLMEGIHIILMLVQVFDASRSRMPYYYAAAYAPPVLVIAISAGLYHQGYGTENYCWLTTERYFIWSFAGPVGAILLANSCILVFAMTMVCRHSEYVFGGKEKNSAEGIRQWIQGAMALEVLLGLTWIVGYFFISERSVAVAYVFTVLNSTQGLFIFIFHCLCNKKARKEYRRVMKVKRRPSTTGSGSTQSASLGKNKLTSGSSFNRHTNSIDNPAVSYSCPA